MKDLKVLKLSIPTLDSSECKTLMGGDGYGYDVIGGDLQECVITADGYRPDHSDYDYQDDILDDEQNDYGYDQDYDNGHDSDYNVPDQLKETFEKLPEKIQDFLKANNIKINYDPNYKNGSGGPASYFSEDKSITTSSLDDNVLLREVIHAVQDAMGSLDGMSHSAEEFQEKALGDLASYFNGVINENGGCGFTLDFSDGNSSWSEFVGSCFDDDDNFDRDAFKEGIMDFFDIFQDTHSNVSGYNDSLEDNYNWHWDEFFDLLGL